MLPVEINSPGHLPNNLTIEKIKAGNSNIRNSTLVTFIAKGLLPYRGIGTGIRRAYDDWDQIDLTDDRDTCTFTATVQRQPVSEELVDTALTEVSAGGPMGGQKGGQKPLTKRQQQLYDLLRKKPNSTRAQIVQSMGINSSAVQKHIKALKQKGVIKRIGGAKGGYWQMIDEE